MLDPKNVPLVTEIEHKDTQVIVRTFSLHTNPRLTLAYFGVAIVVAASIVTGYVAGFQRGEAVFMLAGGVLAFMRSRVRNRYVRGRLVEEKTLSLT